MSDEVETPPAEAPAEKPAKAKTPAAKKGKPEDKGKDKDKGGKSKKGSAEASGGLSVASHPRASASVRQVKGWGGLVAFGITAYVSLSHGVAPDVAGLRALGAGIAGYVVSWGCAVVVWRQLMIAEVRARIEAARPKPHPEAGAPTPAGSTEQAAPAQP